MSEAVEDYCSSKLYVWGDDLDPEWVTALLGMEPDKTRAPGEKKIPSSTQGGQSLAMWRKEIDEERRFWDVNEQLRYWCDVLDHRADAIRELTVKGAVLEIDCYINEGPVVLIELPAALLGRLAKLRVSLKFGFYDRTGRI